jgi:hypothetical protein
VITIAMSTVVNTPRERVWRAIAEPAEMIRWDDHVISLETSAPGYPESGEAAHWRYRFGSVAVDLLDRPLEVVRGQRLKHAMSIGAFEFEEVYTLAGEGSQRTRLSLRLASSSNSVPVVGGELDRFDVRRLASELVDRNLRSIQKWCENHP